jgi:membrane-associated phospholipid phosphatase
MRLSFRASEWLLLAFFAYIALLIPFFRDRPRLHGQPLVLLCCAIALIAVIAYGERLRLGRPVSYARDWLPLGLTLVAFREMELFEPLRFDLRWETVWAEWDCLFLNGWHVIQLVDVLGKAIPCYLELSYLFVYGVAAYCLLLLYAKKERSRIDRFFTIYLTGTLLAYALFPYFPSQPPRIAFPHACPPPITAWPRAVNLAILHAATIHAGVFPSAHVSSTFSAAWAMFLVLPRRKVIGWVLVAYAVSVSIATVYGRYHYTADVAAGFGVSLAAAALAIMLRAREMKTEKSPNID